MTNPRFPGDNEKYQQFNNDFNSLDLFHPLLRLVKPIILELSQVSRIKKHLLAKLIRL